MATQALAGHLDAASGGGTATVVFRAASTATGTDNTAEGVTPTNTRQGDVQVAFLTSTSSSFTVSSVPTGWTLLQANDTVADFTAWSYWKTYQAGDPAPTWTLSGSGNWAIDIVAYSGCDPSSPINGSNLTVAAASNAVSSGSVIPSSPNCMVVVHGAVDATSGTRTWTESGSMTERLDQVDNQLYRVLADELLSGGSGVSVSRTLTVTDTAQDMSGLIVVLTPTQAVLGTVTINRDIAGNSSASDGATTGPATIARSLSGTPGGSAGGSGAVSADRPLQGTSGDSNSASADLARLQTLLGDTHTATELTGSLAVNLAVAGTVSAAAGASGPLGRVQLLQAILPATNSLTGTLNTVETASSPIIHIRMGTPTSAARFRNGVQTSAGRLRAGTPTYSS